MKTLNIDADIMRYMYGAMEQKHPFLNSKMPCSEAKVTEAVDKFITHLLKHLEADDFRLFLTGHGNFRKDIAVSFPYKGKRAKLHKPYHWMAVSEHLFNTYPDKIVLAEGCEADDLLALHQTEDTILCSIDKDLHMVQGKHYSWETHNCAEKPVYTIDEDTAHYNFMYQLLVGDWGTDSILGCAVLADGTYKGKPTKKRKGVGAKAAKKLLAFKSKEEQWETVQHQYRLLPVNNWVEYLTEQGRLLYMGQTPTTLWQPEITIGDQYE